MSLDEAVHRGSGRSPGLAPYRALQIHNRYRERGGELTVVEAEAQQLQLAGHSVVAYQVENPGDQLNAAVRLAASAWNARAARRLRTFLDHREFDVAHVHNTWFSLSAAILPTLQQAGVPVVATVHNYRYMCANALLYRSGAPCQLCVGSDPWAAIRYRCYRDSWVASAAAAFAIAVNQRRRIWVDNIDVLLALTPFTRGLLVDAGIPPEMIRIKPNFVADPGRRQRPPSAAQRVLVIGRISEEKGVELALQAWGARRPPGLELVVVGEGPQRPQLEALDVPGVTFVGGVPHDEVLRLLATSRAVMFPSRWYEGQPMVLLEAFASGAPVLAHEHGSLTDMLAPTPEWRVRRPTRASWADALDLVLDDVSVDTAGAAVRNEYEVSYTPAVGLAGLEDAYALASRRAGKSQ